MVICVVMSFCHGTLFIHLQLHPVVARKKFVSFQNKINDSALGFMAPESNKLTINHLNHVGCGLVLRALVLRLSFLVKDPGAMKRAPYSSQPSLVTKILSFDFWASLLTRFW